MKYFAAVFVTAVLVFLGATVYYKGLPAFPSYTRTGTSTESGEPNVSTGTESEAPEATPNGTKIVSGGILVFSKYSINIPSGWSYTKEAAPAGDIALDKLTITKGSYKISLYQAATGGAGCLYPGDPEVEGPSYRYTSFTDLTTSTGEKLRRGGTAGGSGFTVCQRQSGSWGQPTEFGHISVASPASPSATTLVEIDLILSSLSKK